MVGLAAEDADGGRALRLEATRFLDREDRRGASVYRVEEPGPGVFWIVYTLGKVARHAIVAGAKPSGWRLIADDEGWPV